MVKLILRFVATAVALLIISYYVPGIAISSFTTALIVALLWGLMSLTVRPLLGLLTLPITILTLGLFSFILNALLFWILSLLVPGFTIDGFIPALEGSVLLSIVSAILHGAL